METRSQIDITKYKLFIVYTPNKFDPMHFIHLGSIRDQIFIFDLHLCRNKNLQLSYKRHIQLHCMLNREKYWKMGDERTKYKFKIIYILYIPTCIHIDSVDVCYTYMSIYASNEYELDLYKYIEILIYIYI